MITIKKIPSKRQKPLKLEAGCKEKASPSENDESCKPMTWRARDHATKDQTRWAWSEAKSKRWMKFMGNFEMMIAVEKIFDPAKSWVRPIWKNKMFRFFAFTLSLIFSVLVVADRSHAGEKEIILGLSAAMTANAMQGDRQK